MTYFSWTNFPSFGFGNYGNAYGFTSQEYIFEQPQEQELGYIDAGIVMKSECLFITDMELMALSQSEMSDLEAMLRRSPAKNVVLTSWKEISPQTSEHRLVVEITSEVPCITSLT